jgi:hypothetical protein
MNNMDGSMPKADLKINPQDLDWVGCEKGIQSYESGYLFKRLPGLMSPSGNEEYIPAEIVLCKQCGKAPKFIWSKIPDFPEDMKSTCGNSK